MISIALMAIGVLFITRLARPSGSPTQPARATPVAKVK